MFLRNWSARLLPGLALAGSLLAAPAAQPFTCGPTEELLLENSQFQDCSGTTNFATTGFSGVEHDSFFDGGFIPVGFFTHLHLTFTNSGVTVAFASFENEEVSTHWDVEIMDNMVWFTAPDFNSRVIGGQFHEYFWIVGLNGTDGLNQLRVQFEYTMDVPEPSAALLLTPAFLGLAGLAAARRRRLN